MRQTERVGREGPSAAGETWQRLRRSRQIHTRGRDEREEGARRGEPDMLIDYRRHVKIAYTCRGINKMYDSGVASFNTISFFSLLWACGRE